VADENYVERARRELEARYPRAAANTRLGDLYLLLVLTRGESVTLADVHDAWAVEQSRRRPDHWSIKPFEELDPDVAGKDQKYVTLIREVAAALREERA
jgi:hypothetical protein